MNGTVIVGLCILGAMLGIAFSDRLTGIVWWMAFLPGRVYAAIHNAIMKNH